MKRFMCITAALSLLLMAAGPVVSGNGARPVRAPDLTHPVIGSATLMERVPDYAVLLESRRFVPQPGMSRDLQAAMEAGGRKHVIVQFMGIPDRSDVSLLESRGIELLDYLPNRAYFAGVPAIELARLAAFPGVRSVGRSGMNLQNTAGLPACETRITRWR
jgi:hypothetical protein